MILKIVSILFIFFIFLIYFLQLSKQSILVKPIIVQSNQIQDIKTESIFNPNIPSIDQIFSNNHTWEATLSAQRVRTMIATGDVIPARSVNLQVLLHKDFKWPYLKTADVTKNADITFVNLETPLLKVCKSTQEGIVFCGDTKNVEGLVYAGINVVSLANNHVGNYGIYGVQETVDLLRQNNILVTGINGPVIKEVRGMRFAFLGYDDIAKTQIGISNAEELKIKIEITAAKKQADVVIVTFHWGIEYRDQPDDRQRKLGHLAIDSGADLVIGNHPHWIQPIEVYRDKLITYAHGNFVFDQMWSQKTREGVIGKYTFYDNKLINVEYFPIQIDSYGQPQLLTSTTKKNILEQMKSASQKLSAQSR